MSDSRTKFEEMNNREVKITIDTDNNGMVIHPTHYGGKDNPYEAIKVIEAWEAGFNLGNTLKYISRAGKKDNIKGNKFFKYNEYKKYYENKLKKARQKKNISKLK